MRNSINVITYYLIIMCLMLSVIVLGGCSGTASSKDNQFVELLKLIPESAKEAGGFAIIDYKKILSVNGISLYASDGQKISKTDFFDKFPILLAKQSFVGNDILGTSSWYTGWGGDVFVSPIQKEYIGYDFSDVDAEINISTSWPIYNQEEADNFKPNFMVAAIGKYSQQATSDALKNQSDWPSWAVANYTTETYGNIIINSWGDGTAKHEMDIFSPPHLDILGQARPLAVSGGHLFISNSIKDVKSMIDSSQKKTRSLADVQEYALAVQSMYALGVVGALFADEALANGYSFADSYKGPRLKKYLTFGIGSGKDKKGEYVALVLVHDSTSIAKDNITLLNEQISKLKYYDQALSSYLYDIKIQTEGKVLSAKLYTNNETIGSSWFLYHSPILLHE